MVVAIFLDQIMSEKFIRETLPKPIRSHIELLERMRQDFVANVSHELRTPLTVIRGYLELLKNQHEFIGTKYETMFSQMLQHSLRMGSLIEDLLLLSHLESHEQEADPGTEISVSELLEQIVEDAKNISGANKHKIKLQADKHLYLMGIKEELKSLFSNLIINAVKYTPAEGSIKIRWYDEDGRAAFSVTDTGIGIAKKHIPRITERFYRVDKARSRDSGGTGLGLAIVKHVLLRHEAELEIESQLNKGSTFTCWFPPSRLVRH